jgi:ABC-2 type transport system ATP-binding protein
MNNLSPAIEITALHKSYGSVKALQGVDVTIQRGEIFGFLGPNGAGKTTTIRCVLDLIRPDSGQIHVLGIDPQQDPVAVREKVSYLPGELNLDAGLKVSDQLRYLSELRGNTVDWRYVERLAQRFDLNLNLRIKNLSKGNKQKVGIVQALMQRSNLLILDEPTSGLDPLMQQEVLKALKEARDDGATVFFSSHIISEVEAIADRVAIIRKGVIVETVTPEALAAMQIRRVRVTFENGVTADAFTQLAGIKVLPQDRERSLRFEISGEMDAFIKILGRFTVVDLEMERPTLEGAFMAYYQERE